MRIQRSALRLALATVGSALVLASAMACSTAGTTVASDGTRPLNVDVKGNIGPFPPETGVFFTDSMEHDASAPVAVVTPAAVPTEAAAKPAATTAAATTDKAGCTLVLLRKSDAAVGDVCLTTVEFMRRDLSFTDKQIQRVLDLAGHVGSAH